MTKTLLAYLMALALMATVPCMAVGQGAKSAPTAEQLMARLQEAKAKNQRVTVKFKSGAHVSGQIGEVRKRGVTLIPQNTDAEDKLKQLNATAAILYEDIASVERSSRAKKFFQRIGFGVLFAGEDVIAIPLYAVSALLGRLPSC